jgi:tetratricopeptide (TPR) repeat protein
MHEEMKTPAALFFLIIAIFKNGFTQGISIGKTADSLYFSKNWAEAKTEYKKFLSDTSINSVIWNRMGYCNQNLGLYSEAISDYNKCLANHPVPMVKSSAESRLAMVYSLMNKTSEAENWLIKATLTGYNSLNDLDSLDVFSNLRGSANFKEIRRNIYEIIYPCSKNPRNRDFDFWIGDWDCYRTGSKILSGYSHVEVMAGGCAILENYLSTQAYSGKSFNFYDTATGKWEQDWIGSGGPGDRQHFYSGEYRDSTMHFIYEKTNANGEKVKGNFIFYFINENTVRQYQDVMDANGKTVSVIYDLTYLRKN